MTAVQANLLVRVRAKDQTTGLYPVEAELDDGSRPTGGTLKLDPEELLSLELEPAAYGMALFNALFTGPIRSVYDRAAGRALAAPEGRLRVRLWLENGAAELHAIPWERLYHPYREHEVPLAASHATPFSRYTGLDIPEPRPVAQRPVRLLLAVSNPSNIEDYELREVDVAEEARSLVQVFGELGAIQVTILPGRTGLPPELRRELEQADCRIIDGPLTLNAIARALLGHPILHMVSHGMFDPSVGAALYLEDDDGKTAVSTDVAIAAKLAPLDPQPHLIYLAACESATRDARNPMIGLAPRLMAAGVPAVVGMQAPVPVVVDRQFSQDFYRRLLEHGAVDQAANEARNLLVKRDSVDWAIPVLFMRLKEGRIIDKRWEHEQTAETRPYQKEKSMTGLSPELYGRIRRALLDCGPLESDAGLFAVFGHPSLRPWRSIVQQAAYPGARADALIARLVDRKRADTRESALALLLRVLSERVDSIDPCHEQLATLANEVEAVLG